MFLAIPAIVVTCFAVTLVVVYRRLCAGGAILPVTAEWIDELSVDRYRPMTRLLENEDPAFLQTQPGFTPGMAAHFRRERCRIFRGYLRCLQSDFERVSMALKVVMVQSRHDRPDLAAVLVRSQRAFALGMILVYSQLLLYRLGLASVDATELLRVFDGARLELRSLMPADLSAPA